MPTYDYVCGACDHQFELFQSITASPVRKCPQCGRLKLRRLIGPGAAVVFKGSGFYQTDYRSASYKKAAEAERKNGSSESSKSKSEGKSESKSTSKSESKSESKSSAASCAAGK